MSIFQVISVLFALFMMYVVSIQSKKKTLTVLETNFWYTTWISFMVISIFPFLLQGIAGVLRFSRVFDLLVVLALMVLTFVIITSYFAQKENTRKLEQLVRQIALNDHEKKTK
ncbi:MAG TPA: DUF2304 family protein [Patescibacteria group bacterium]